MFWPLQSSSEFLGVPEDSKLPFSGVWVATSHFLQSGVATQLHHWSWGRSATSIWTHLQFNTRQTYSASWIHWQEYRKGVHSTFQIFNWCHYLPCKKENWFFMNVCWLSWTKSTCHQESIPFVLNLKVVTLTKSCQSIHPNWFTWNI